MKVAKAILFVTNTLLLLVGGGVIGVAAYVLGFNGDFDEVAPTFITLIALATGAVVVVVSLMACVATCNYHKKWAKVILMFYSFLLFIILAMEIGAAAMVWLKRDEIAGCETASFGTTDCPDNQHLLRNFANSTHQTCCVEANDRACTWVEDVVTDANCADHELWRRELFEYVNGKLQPVAIFVVVSAVIEAVTILATCYLMNQHDDNLVHPSGAIAKLPTAETAGGDMPTKSRAVLLVVNTILFVLGGCMVAFSAWLLDFNTNAGDAMSSGGPAVGLAAGALIIILSLMGCIGACNWTKRWAKILLFVYDVILLAIIFAEIIGAVLIFFTLQDLEGCRDSPFGSAECEDSTAAIRDWVNETRIDCCFPVENRDNKECRWAADVITDSTCVDFDTFKSALIDYISDRMLPMAIFVVLVALIQLVTFCSTCCLIKAKGKAIVSGNMRRMYKQPSFFYDNYEAQRQQKAAAPAASAGEWATARDNRNRVYYYNKRTRETRWDPPPELVV